MINILLTGGAGYIGSVLVPYLLNTNYKITVFDSLLYGGTSLLPIITNKNFTFIKGDIRDKDSISKIVKNHDIIIHLAAIVGFLACEKNKELASSTNVHGNKEYCRKLIPRSEINSCINCKYLWILLKKPL